MADEQRGAAADWPLYQGTKRLRAHPINKAVYCEIRGWAVPADEDPAERGYIVEYTDGGKPNVDGYSGYISWSPADVFEGSYKRCGSHIDRMAIELAELTERVTKLYSFMMGNNAYAKLPVEEKAMLNTQGAAMMAYQGVLQMRFDRATGAPPREPIRPV